MNKGIYTVRFLIYQINLAIRTMTSFIVTGNGFKLWMTFGLFVISTIGYGQYCLPTYQTPSCTSGDYISGVQFSSISNQGVTCPPGNSNYNDFSGSICTSVCPGSVYTLIISNNATNGEYMAACIDLNGNGSFADPGEFFAVGYAAPGADVSINIVIPMNATPGGSMFRVFCQGGNAALTANDICGNLLTGNVQDYCMTINGPVIVNLGNNVTQCGNSVTLNANNFGQSYAWSDGSSNQTLQVMSSGIYSVTVTTGVGCSASSSVQVSLSTPPSVSLGNDTTQCGGTVTLDAANPGQTYSWSDGETTQAIQTNISGTYSVTVTNGVGCAASSSVQVTINPVPLVALGNDITQCGGTVNLNAANPGQSYAWSDGETAQIIQTGISGTYSVTVTNTANGCFASDTILITINPVPVVSLSMIPPKCGGIDTLDAGNAGSTYLWSDGSSNQTLKTGTGGTYSVTVTNGFGCSASASTQVYIYSLPVVYLGSDITRCGGSVTLDAANPNQGYAWSDGETTQTIQALTSGNYSVSVTNVSNGCVAADSIIVIIDSIPVVVLNTVVPQCGGFDTLDAGNAGSTYLWSDGSTNQTLIVSSSAVYRVTITDGNLCSTTASENVIIHPLPVVTLNIQQNVCNTIADFRLYGGAPAGGTYYVDHVADTSFNTIDAGIAGHNITYIYTDPLGCIDSAATYITVRQHPFITTLDFPQTCAGSLPIDLNNYFTPAGGVYIGLGVSTHFFYPPLSGAGKDTIIDIVTDSYGCIDTSIFPFIINPAVKVSMTPSILDNAICAGQTVSFNAFGAENYQFFVNGMAKDSMSSTSTFSTFGLQNGDIITVVGTNVCSADTSAPVGFDVHPLPVVTAGADTSIALGQSVQLNAVASGNGLLVYQWSPAALLSVANIPNPVYSGSADSVVFTISVSDTYGCIDSSHVTIHVFVPDAIVLPNIITPDGNGKNDTWKINSRVDLTGSKLIIFNRWGETVFYEQSYKNDWGGTYKDTGEKLPDGTYYYELAVPSQDNHLYKGAINILNGGGK